MNKFEPAIEFQPRNIIKAFQEEKLAEALAYLNAKSNFYKRMFETHHIDIKKIKTLEDLQVIHPVQVYMDVRLFLKRIWLLVRLE